MSYTKPQDFIFPEAYFAAGLVSIHFDVCWHHKSEPKKDEAKGKMNY